MKRENHFFFLYFIQKIYEIHILNYCHVGEHILTNKFNLELRFNERLNRNKFFFLLYSKIYSSLSHSPSLSPSFLFGFILSLFFSFFFFFNLEKK